MNGATHSGVFELSPDGKLIALKGYNGSIYLFTGRSKEYIGCLQMNDRCEALAFSKSGKQLSLNFSQLCAFSREDFEPFYKT